MKVYQCLPCHLSKKVLIIRSSPMHYVTTLVDTLQRHGQNQANQLLQMTKDIPQLYESAIMAQERYVEELHAERKRLYLLARAERSKYAVLFSKWNSR